MFIDLQPKKKGGLCFGVNAELCQIKKIKEKGRELARSTKEKERMHLVGVGKEGGGRKGRPLRAGREI